MIFRCFTVDKNFVDINFNVVQMSEYFCHDFLEGEWGVPDPERHSFIKIFFPQYAECQFLSIFLWNLDLVGTQFEVILEVVVQSPRCSNISLTSRYGKCSLTVFSLSVLQSPMTRILKFAFSFGKTGELYGELEFQIMSCFSQFVIVFFHFLPLGEWYEVLFEARDSVFSIEFCADVHRLILLFHWMTYVM